MVNQVRDLSFARTYLAFGKARLTATLDDRNLTHVVVSNNDLSRLSQIRSTLSTYFLLQRITNRSDVLSSYLVL